MKKGSWEVMRITHILTPSAWAILGKQRGPSRCAIGKVLIASFFVIYRKQRTADSIPATTTLTVSSLSRLDQMAKTPKAHPRGIAPVRSPRSRRRASLAPARRVPRPPSHIPPFIPSHLRVVVQP
jgi:hypothetical protein